MHEGCTCTHVRILKKYKKHLNTRTQSAHIKGDQERPGIGACIAVNITRFSIVTLIVSGVQPSLSSRFLETV